MATSLRGHLLMRPSAKDRANLAIIADRLRNKGREPNTADILRHALQVAADAAGTPPAAAIGEGTTWTP